MNPETDEAIKSIEWCDGYVRILDQTFLPARTVYSDIRDVGRMWEAIKSLRVRGAPAIGIAAAYGFYLGIKELPESKYPSFWVEVKRLASYLASARPTAVNLQWALDRIMNTIHAHKTDTIAEIKSRVLKVAQTIHDEDRRICKQIGLNGQELIPKNVAILTHCNTGGLATAQYGTALSVIYHAHIQKKNVHVWVNETRPLLQGSRLTAWELSRAEIPFKIITDSTGPFLMQQKKIDLVLVGTDRVAANGDMANKIGTYMLAVAANYHNIPFYVAAPASSIDLAIADGTQIEIEERDGKEVTSFGNSETAPAKVSAYNPAFDITPARLISAYITDKGIIKPDYDDHLKDVFG